MESRFLHSSNSDFEALEQASSITNIKKSTLNWLRVFTDWKINHCYNVEIESYKPADSNVIFRLHLWKTDGIDYNPACLRVMMSALDRWHTKTFFSQGLLLNILSNIIWPFESSTSPSPLKPEFSDDFREYRS